MDGRVAKNKAKEPVDYDGWKEVKTIGTGGFGMVILFRNEELDQEIALKKCRVMAEMQAKHKQRWQMEIQIMIRLDHQNVIRAMEVPEPLLVLQEAADMPMLAMEYCSEGDLRNLINKHENCCGLTERQVRDLTRDVGRGVEYLHSNRIIHRDLKPENIVMNKTDDGKIIYKLIDLGYAKDMEQGSVCTSFVGTLQYLAPELFQTHQYSATVDYWSFGTLIFECITGFRPFLHNYSPVQWQSEVERKKYEDIHAYLGEQGTIQFSKSLPEPNLLCKPSRSFFEAWLRMMLVWKPTERGGKKIANKRHECFQLLDQIINTKILYILSVNTIQLLTIPISDTEKPLSTYLNIVATETGIAMEDQELLFASGMPADRNQPAALCWTDEITSDKEEHILFLFRKDGGPMDSLVEWKAKHRPLPPMVAEMLGEPEVLMVYLEQRKVWSHALYFVRQVRQDYERLLEAEVAVMMSLLRHNTHFTRQRLTLTKDVASLAAKIDMYKASYTFDLSKYEEQAKSGITSKKMLTRWDNMKREVDEINKLIKEASALESHGQALNTRVLEINRSPYARTKNNQRMDPELEDVSNQCMELYKKLRHMKYDQRQKGQDNKAMVGIVYRCLTAQESAISNLHAHFSTIAKCQHDLVTQLPRVEAMIARIHTAEQTLMTHQKQRQKDMWYLISVALYLSRNAPQTPEEKEPNSQQTPETSQENLPQLNLVSMPDQANNRPIRDEQTNNQPIRQQQKERSEGSMSSNIFIESEMQKSMMVISDNSNSRGRMKNLMEGMHSQLSITPQQPVAHDTVDWGFLDTSPQTKQPTPHSQQQQHVDAQYQVPVSQLQSGVQQMQVGSKQKPAGHYPNFEAVPMQQQQRFDIQMNQSRHRGIAQMNQSQPTIGNYQMKESQPAAVNFQMNQSQPAPVNFQMNQSPIAAPVQMSQLQAGNLGQVQLPDQQQTLYQPQQQQRTGSSHSSHSSQGPMPPSPHQTRHQYVNVPVSMATGQWPAGAGAIPKR